MGQQYMQILLYGQGLEGLQNRRWEYLEQHKEGENGTKKVKELPHRPGTSELLKFHLNYDAKPTGNVLCSRVRLSYLCCDKITLVAG